MGLGLSPKCGSASQLLQGRGGERSGDFNEVAVTEKGVKRGWMGSSLFFPSLFSSSSVCLLDSL